MCLIILILSNWLGACGRGCVRMMCEVKGGELRTSPSHSESERERLFFKDGFYSDNCILIQ